MGKGDTTTSSEPPSWAKPLFQQSAAEAQKLYDAKTGFHSWQGNTVATPSPQTQAGIQGLLSAANQPNGQALSNNSIDFANWTMNNRGLSGQEQDAATNLFQIGNQGGISYQGQNAIDRLYNQGKGFGPSDRAENLYGDMARGQNLTGNPFFSAALQDQSDEIAQQMNRQFAAGGRYGSGAHQGVLERELGQMRTAALSDNFNRERGFQMQAIQGLLGDQQQQYANRFGATNAAMGAEQQGQNAAMQAMQAGAGMKQAGMGQAQNIIGQMPGIQQNRVFDENLRLQAGGMLDQQKQAELNDAIRKFTEKDMEPITRLGFLQAAAGGAAGPYGVTQQSQQSSPLSMLMPLLSLFM
mgnify:CR=1 FL=1